MLPSKGTHIAPWHRARVQQFSSVTQACLGDLSRKKRQELPKGKDSARGLKSVVGNAAWLGLPELPLFSLGNKNGTKKPQNIFAAYTEVTLEKGSGLQKNQNYDLTGTTEAWPESCLTLCGLKTLSKNWECSWAVRRSRASHFPLNQYPKLSHKMSSILRSAALFLSGKKRMTS